MAFSEFTVGDWLDELAQAPGVPGSGAALAFAVASAAAVVAMAARVSDGGGLAAQAESLRARASTLADRDAQAYADALGVRDRAAGLKPEQRDWEIGRAFALAAEPPLELARTAADVARLAAEVGESGDPRVRADALAAARLAAGAARGAVELVAVNLTAVEGDARVAEAERCAAAAEAAAKAASA